MRVVCPTANETYAKEEKNKKVKKSNCGKKYLT